MKSACLVLYFHQVFSFYELMILKYLRGDFLQNRVLFAQNQSDRTD